jgi:hypothetical protein
MTVEWWHYSQSLTKKTMKAMLTSPVTILNWSFVRDDIPRSEFSKQIALAISDEVGDLERRYLDWAGEIYFEVGAAFASRLQLLLLPLPTKDAGLNQEFKLRSFPSGIGLAKMARRGGRIDGFGTGSSTTSNGRRSISGG